VAKKSKNAAAFSSARYASRNVAATAPQVSPQAARLVRKGMSEGEGIALCKLRGLVGWLGMTDAEVGGYDPNHVLREGTLC
jgi:hypothetical protein